MHLIIYIDYFRLSSYPQAPPAPPMMMMGSQLPAQTGGGMMLPSMGMPMPMSGGGGGPPPPPPPPPGIGRSLSNDGNDPGSLANALKNAKLKRSNKVCFKVIQFLVCLLLIVFCFFN